jgi:ATPase subunit of ABC transporter with duplicated ATPase domains
VLAIVHDRYFIEHFATGLWAIREKGVRAYVDLEDMRRGQRLGQGGLPGPGTASV